MIYDHRSYREFLKAQLAEEFAINPSFSQRAFAAKLGLANSTLAEILSGKKNLSTERAMLIAEKLELNPKETQYFIQLIDYQNAKSEALRALALDKLNEISPQIDFRDLSIDHFKVISEWHHVPILAMCELNNFEATAAEIAKKLKLSKIEVEVAIERMKRLELIDIDQDGVISKSDTTLRIKSVAPNLALKNFHRQVIKKVEESLDSQTPQEKFISTNTFALDEEDLPKIAEAAREFLTKINQIAEKSKKKNHLYHAFIDIFRITEKSTGKKQ